MQDDALNSFSYSCLSLQKEIEKDNWNGSADWRKYSINSFLWTAANFSPVFFPPNSWSYFLLHHNYCSYNEFHLHSLHKVIFSSKYQHQGSQNTSISNLAQALLCHVPLQSWLLPYSLAGQAMVLGASLTASIMARRCVPSLDSAAPRSIAAWFSHEAFGVRSFHEHREVLVK